MPGININTHPPIELCAETPTRIVTNITGGGYQPAGLYILRLSRPDGSSVFFKVMKE